MLKLLYIPTGNIFVLPDEEALEQQRLNPYNYKILDAGYQEAKEEKVSEEEVKEILETKEERIKEIEKEDEVVEEVHELKENPKRPKVTEDTLNLDKMTKADLVAVAHRLGVEANHNELKQTLIDRIRATGVIK